LSLCLALLLLAAWLSPGPGLASNGDSTQAYGAIIASQQTTVQTATAASLSTYALDAAFTPAQPDRLATITGRLSLHWINLTGAPQSTLFLRLYPNSVIYSVGGMTIAAAALNGTSVPVALSVHNTVAALSEPAPVAPHASSDLSVTFTTTIPTDPRDTYGMFQFDSAAQVYALANWFPILAGFDAGYGWLIDPPAAIGDPVFTNAALFNVRLTAPSAFKIAAGGSETSAVQAAGLTTHAFVAGPARDFATAISDQFQTVTQRAGETNVTSYFLPGGAQAGANALNFGARALKLYSERFGTYPYRQMDLVEMPLGGGAGGVEFPELVFLGSDYYAGDSSDALLSLDFLVAHEVAHQWFYGQVGNNQYRHAFLDEALANVSAVLDFQTQRGADAAKLVVNRAITAPYLSFLTNHGDLVVDAPSGLFPSVLAYNAIVYGKAVLGFRAIRDQIGEQTFDAGLALYVSRYRFTTAVPQNLLACFNEASGEDLTSLWNHWFEETHGLTDLNVTPAATPINGPGA